MNNKKLQIASVIWGYLCSECLRFMFDFPDPSDCKKLLRDCGFNENKNTIKKIQNTQEIKRTLFNETKQDKMCKFSMQSSFSSYIRYNRKQLNQLICVH